MASQIDSMNETFYQEVKAGLQSRQKKCKPYFKE